MRQMSGLPIVLILAAAAVLPVACATTRPAASGDAPGPAVVPAVAAGEVGEAPVLPSGAALKSPRPGLYTAGQPGAEDWPALAAAGVRTVIDLRAPGELQGRDERSEVEAAGLRYVQIPVAGASAIDADKAAQLSALLSGADGAVLVHCASGNRVGGLLAVAMAQSGMRDDEALAFGRSAGMRSTEARAREVIAERRDAEQHAQLCPAGAAPDPTQCAAP